MQFCGVIPALNPVQLRFLIVDITTIADRVALAPRIGQRAGGAPQLAPCIVLVFYYKRAGAVKNANDISLQIVDVGIDNAIVADLYRTALRIVEEVQLVLLSNLIPVMVIHRHVRQQLAVVGVVRGFGVPVMLQYLLDSHTVMIVLEVQRPVFSNHLLQLAACRPGERPCTVVQRSANGVVGTGSAVVRSQLVLPIRIAVGIRNSFQHRADRTSSESILHLGGDVSATVVVVHPGRILMRIVHTDQLAQGVVDIGRGQRAALLGNDVASAVVGVLEGNTILGDLLH